MRPSNLAWTKGSRSLKEEITNTMLDNESAQKDWENLLVESLMQLEIIFPQFTGSITLHFTQGGLGDIDRYEKNLKKIWRPANRLSRLPK